MTLSTFFRKLFSPFMLGNCLGVVVAAVVVFFGFLYYLQCYTDHGDSVTVPNLRGQRLDVAQQKLEAIGLGARVVDTGYVDTYVGDVVLEQTIRPGEHVKTGRIVELTINAASARAIALPMLADNCSRREAEAKLKALGFKSVRVEYIPGDQDWVYDVKIHGKSAVPGERVPVTTLVTLVIGDGVVEEEYNGSDTLDTYYLDDEIGTDSYSDIPL
ncbi:MAG: PASTA domain-containing protein [Bacteroidales bacterium]|nr:PASTA domain-containing protein [Bacteroidales bacterium]